MPHHPLTKRPDVAKIKPITGKTTMYSDPDMKHDRDARGIRLSVGATTKTWVITKRVGASVRTITLGSFPDLPTLFDARDKAKEKLEEIKSGTDAKTTGIETLHDALESHIARSSASERTKQSYRDQVRNHMDDLFKRKIETITLDDLEVVMRGLGIATQKHLAQIIRTSFKRAAAVRRCYNVADDLKVNTKGHRPDDRVKFDTAKDWPALALIDEKKAQNLIIGTAFELMLFTGLRAGNVIGLKWDDVDLDSAYLRVARLKNGRQGKFPLANRVVAALRKLPRHSQWVFPQHDATKHIYHPDRLGDDHVFLRPHDCRRLFTTAARKLELPAYIIDQLRGDVEKGVQGRYDQGSITHHHSNAVAQQIEVECGSLPDSNVVQIAEMR